MMDEWIIENEETEVNGECCDSSSSSCNSCTHLNSPNPPENPLENGLKIERNDYLSDFLAAMCIMSLEILFALHSIMPCSIGYDFKNVPNVSGNNS